MMEWWLIRHGLTEWNTQRKYQGHSDLELLPGDACGLLGLREELAGVLFSAVFSSDLLRCRQTLSFARPDLVLGSTTDPRLREMNFGAWEGKTYDMLKDLAVYRTWIDDPKAVTPPEGESWHSFQERVAEMGEELLAVSKRFAEVTDNVRLLVITHGGVIAMLSALLQPGLGFWNTRVSPGGVFRLELMPNASISHDLLY